MTSYLPFSTVPPHAKQQPEPFKLHIDDAKLQDLKTLLKLSPVAKETYENLQDDGSHGKFGISRKWIVEAKTYWKESFDWRAHESHINSFPAYTTSIQDNASDTTLNVHFTALFSTKSDAIPIALFHGWPGSFLEFLPIMSLLQKKYTPETLPYHIIVPSLPGFTLSSQPPLSQDWNVGDTARVMHELMLSLGFGSGYLVQGGDIGAMVSRALASTYDECKGMHLNFMFGGDLDKYRTESELTAKEKNGIERMEGFKDVGRAYAMMHQTKPSTIGLVVASSPIAQLAWIGEKFLAWTDPSTIPSMDTILTNISLYWLTGCYPTSIYTYRQERVIETVSKPSGYSYFPYELAPVPRAWAANTANLVFFKDHEHAGHFAALEQPEVLLADVEEFIKVAWKSG